MVGIGNFPFLCPTVFFSQNTQNNRNSRIIVRENVFQEAERQVFGSLHNFLFPTVLALPSGGLQVSAVLMHSDPASDDVTTKTDKACSCKISMKQVRHLFLFVCLFV